MKMLVLNSLIVTKPAAAHLLGGDRVLLDVFVFDAAYQCRFAPAIRAHRFSTSVRN